MGNTDLIGRIAAALIKGELYERVSGLNFLQYETILLYLAINLCTFSSER